MVIHQGEVWWAELGEPRGAEPGYRRPVVVVQSDTFNRSRIGTVVVAAVTSNLNLARAPGNVSVPAGDSGLPRDSVVTVSQLLTLDRRFLGKRAGVLAQEAWAAVASGMRLVLGLSTADPADMRGFAPGIDTDVQRDDDRE